MHHDKDASSKWLIQHHGDAIVRLAGMPTPRTWKAVQPEVVQPRKTPDGLLELEFDDRPKPVRCVVEIATYAKPDLVDQLERDALLVFMAHRVLPEVVAIVLHPAGGFRAPSAVERTSDLEICHLQLRWRVVELWNLKAEELLAANDVGLVPWVPLTQFSVPPEQMLQTCRERIDQQAMPTERENLLAVAQVLTKLRYNNRELLRILGGRQAMIESPLIQELLAEKKQEWIGTILRNRFETVPTEVINMLKTVEDEGALDDLMQWAVRCPDLEAFRVRLATR
jgi:hypothetical protein